jgi:hypothetical protein
MLLTEASESVRAHLRAIAALEWAVRENWVDIPARENSLAALRERSDDAVWRYRAHFASMHAHPPLIAESVNTSVAV